MRMDKLTISTTKRRLTAFSAGLALLLAAAPSSARTVTLGGTGAALGGMELLAAAFSERHPDTKVEIVPGLGSTGGVKAVLAGAIDVGVAARALREKEQHAGAVAQEYARTPFVFATQVGNPATDISLDQVAEAYRGNLTTWPDGRQIRLVLRPLADSDTAIVADLSPALGEAVRAVHRREGLKIAATDQDCADAIETLPGSLGTSTLALIRAEKRAIKALSLDGVEPTAANVIDGSYTLVKSLWIVTGATPSAEVESFVSFVMSADGQRILAEAGHLSATPR